ncbi:MAG: TRAP transporter small permease [Pseudomonadota bacterium]
MSQYRPSTTAGRVINEIEETLIAAILGAMTLITFANVVARYVFNANILWALESTVFLFAWLVLLGAAYCVKITAHLGVDVMINAFPPAGRRVMAFIALGCCLAYALLLLIGCWNYWAPFANLPEFDGTWRDQIWYEVNDVPMPGFLSEWGKSINQGEAYEKMPRFIPYLILPLGALLLLLRFAEAGWRLWTGRITALIVSHEVEDDLKAEGGKV